MTDGGFKPWVPPSAPIRPRTPPSPPPVLAPPLPPRQPGTRPAPAASAPKRRRAWVISIIVVSCLAVTVSGVVAVGQWSAAFFTLTLPDPTIVLGTPAPPIAAAPLECPTACFTQESVRGTLAPARAYEELGLLVESAPYGTYDPSPVSALQRAALERWDEDGLAPDACFFVPANAPYAASRHSQDAQSGDPVFFTGTHDDGSGNTIDQSVRLFPSTQAAQDYLADLAHSVDECRFLTAGSGVNAYAATVVPASALGTPASVASAGWVRTGVPGQGWRSYVFDLQRANLVVRSRLVTDGSVREQDFRQFVRYSAAQLAALEPSHE